MEGYMTTEGIEKIIEILKEKDFHVAADNIKKLKGFDIFGGENFLYDIIYEREIYTPQDMPFYFADQIWNMKIANVEENAKILKKIADGPIAKINQAKICDFLWIEEGDYNFAIKALKAYKKHLEDNNDFEFNFMAINRLMYISKKINSKEVCGNIREELIKKVLKEYDGFDYEKILYLLKTATTENVDTDFLLQYTEKIWGSYDENSYDFQIIGEFCDLLEQLYCKKNGWKNEKCTIKPELKTIRRRKAKALLMISDHLESSGSGIIMRQVKYLKDAVNILKTISGTESERKNLLMKIEVLEKKMIATMPVIKVEQNNEETVKMLLQQLEVLDKDEIICYFASFIPFPDKKTIEENIKMSQDSLSDLFPVGILNRDGKSIAKSRPIKKGKNEIDVEAYQEKLEQKTAQTIDYLSQIIIWNILNYIHCHFTITEEDVRKIVEGSAFIPQNRKEAYLKGLMAGFSDDFLTALHILIPQVENSLRELAVICGEPVYNLNENGIEELKTMHAVLELDGIKETLDEDFLLSLKTVFCSKFGLNMRNKIAHGLFYDNQFRSYDALYTWWFILKICYMFCGRLQVENRIKVNNKLQNLEEKNGGNEKLHKK